MTTCDCDQKLNENSTVFFIINIFKKLSHLFTDAVACGMHLAGQPLSHLMYIHIRKING